MKRTLELPQLKSKLLRLLARRDHSASELRQKLRAYYDFSPADFEVALAWLKELKYLPDEAALAERLTQYYRKQGRGSRWIAAKLKTKGLKNQDLRQEDAGEREAAEIFVLKKLKGQSPSELDFEGKQRLARQLTLRGFSSELVRQLLK